MNKWLKTMENWCSPPRHHEDRTGIHPSCACDLVAMSGLFCAPPVHCSGVLQANGPKCCAGAEASTSTSSQMMGSASVQTLHQRGPQPGGWSRAGGGADANHQTVNLVLVPTTEYTTSTPHLQRRGRAPLRKLGNSFSKPKPIQSNHPSVYFLPRKTPSSLVIGKWKMVSVSVLFIKL